MSLKIGMLVDVYEDPLTKKKKEGTARIVYCIEPAGADGFGMYAVNFVGDDPSLCVSRLVEEEKCSCLEFLGDNPGCLCHETKS